MGKLPKRPKKLKEEPVAESISLSFRYYQNADAFKNFRVDLMPKLLADFATLCTLKWRDIIIRPRQAGLGHERLPVVQLSPKPTLPAEDITHVSVIRLSGNKGRLIGFKDEASPMFHVLRVDYDFTAYNHG
jgi:hypothetical protein